ncbi:MAG: hypothetical protein ACOC8B_00570 [Gemmatimonadota bacterium]
MLIGNPEHFAIDVSWLPNPEADGFMPAEAATWAQLKLYADGRIISSNVDAGGGFSESIFCSPLPLATWVLRCWSAIFFEEARPFPRGPDDPFEFLDEYGAAIQTRDDDRADEDAEKLRSWWVSHDIRGGRNGQALPDVLLWRQGPRLQIWWRPDDRPFASANLRFDAAGGLVELDVTAAADLLSTFCDEVRDRLDSAGIGDEDSYAAEFRRLRHEFGDDRHRFLALVSASGLDDDGFERVADLESETVGAIKAGRSPSEEVWRSVTRRFDLEDAAVVPRASDVTGGSAVLALFRSAAPRLTPDDVDELKNLVERARRRDGAGGPLEALQRALPAIPVGAFPRAYRTGHARARVVREAMGLAPEEPVEVEERLEALLERGIEPCRLSDPSIDGVSLWSERLGPVVAINEASRMGSTSWGRRMALESSGLNFAEDDAFVHVMRTFSVGATVAAHQLYNHGFIDDGRRDHLLARYGSPIADA